MGYELDPANPPKQVDMAWVIPQGAYVWDLENKTVARDHSWDGTAKWCALGEFRSFLRLRPGTEKIYDLVQGKLGEEQVQPYPTNHWFNKVSCRYYTERPYWSEEGRRGRAIPLLEKHGYVDFGELSMDSSESRALVFYPAGTKDGLILPLKSDQVDVPPVYAEFADAYLIKGVQHTSDAVPVWLLKPNGIVTKILEPMGKAWEKLGWGHFYLTKKGLFLVGGRGNFASVGTTGGYLLKEGKPERAIAGYVRNAAVSPDGCRIVFVHSLHSQAEADSAKALRAGKPGTLTLKIIDLCKVE